MSKIRFLVVPIRERWTIRRVNRRIGAFANDRQAVAIAMQMAVIEQARGQAVAVLKQDAEGHWDDLVLAASGASAAVLL